MKRTPTLFTCLLALALHNAAWAEKIYETTNAEGETEFTDTPPQEGAKVIELQRTNIADAPPQQPQDQTQQSSQPAAVAPAQAPMQAETPVIVDDNAFDELEAGEERRQRALEAADPQTPDEVGDSMSQMPDEVGDSMNQMPDEVGDFDAPPVEEQIDDGEPQYIQGAPQEQTRRARRHAQ